MTDTLRIPVGDATDLFLERIDDAREQIESGLYELEQLHRIYGEAEVAMTLFEDLNHLAIERSAEMDNFIFPAFKKLQAAYNAATRRQEEP